MYLHKVRFLFYLLVHTAFFSAAAEQIYIRTSYQDNNIYKYNTENSQSPGICIEIMQAVKKIDPDIDFIPTTEPMPLLRIKANMKIGDLGVFCGLIKNAEQEADFTYFNTVLYTLRYKVAVAIDDPIKIDSFNDIRNASAENNVVVTAQGSGYDNFVAKQGIMSIDAGAKDYAANFQKILIGRARFFYQSEVGLRYSIESLKLQNKVKILPTPLHSEEVFFVASKKMPKKSFEKLSKALENIDQQGGLERIRIKYKLD